MLDRRAPSTLLAVVVLLVAACASDGHEPRTASPSAASLPGTFATAPTMLLLDASGSMGTPDFEGLRIQAARSAIRSVVASARPGRPLGLVRVGGSRGDSDPTACDDVSTVVTPRANDHAAVNTAAAKASPTGRTPTGSALRLAAESLPPTGASSIIVVSDGEANCAPYPCDVAAELNHAHPGMVVSVVALHAPAAAFRCLTAPSAGVAVGADNPGQLTRRLEALSDPIRAREQLAPDGINGVVLGQSLQALRKVHPDVPDAKISTSLGDATVVPWRGRTLVFDHNGVLIQIRTGSGSTIDGLSVGHAAASAPAAYGDPLETAATTGAEARVGDKVETFVADPSSGNRWRIVSSAGTIRRIALCRCGPGTVPRFVPDLPDIATLQTLPEAGEDGLFGRWWVRGATLVVDRAARKVYVWATDEQQPYPIEAVARIDRIDGVGGSATITDSNADSGGFAVGTGLAFAGHPLPGGGTTLTVHFARQRPRDWCGRTMVAECLA